MKCMNCDKETDTLCYDVTKSKLLICKECMKISEKLGYDQLKKETKKFIKDIRERLDKLNKKIDDSPQP